MLTRRGFAAVGGGVGLYVAARAGGVDELYVLAAVAVAWPLISLAFVRWSRHRLSYARAVAPPRIFAGGTVRVDVTVRNTARLASPPIYVEDAAPAALGGSIRAAVPSMRPDREVTLSTQRRASARGRYPVGPLRARLVDPFGLAGVSTEVARGAVVTVYPAIEPLHEVSPPEPRGGAGPSRIQRLAAAGEEFYAVREWEHGDDLRLIHWRSSARRDELMIRQNEVRPYPRATILLDTRVTQHADGRAGSSFEWMVSAAGSLVWELGRQGFALRVATADSAPAGARWGREAADPLLTELAVVRRARQGPLSPVLRRLASGHGAGGALIAILPPMPPAEPVVALARLSRAYGWCGAVILNAQSFRAVTPREVAMTDQRVAAVERALKGAGWNVATASASDRFKDVWMTLLASDRSRLSLRY